MNATDLAHEKATPTRWLLKRKRGEMAGEIERLKRMLACRQEQLAHIDATISVLDPAFSVATIRPKRPGR